MIFQIYDFYLFFQICRKTTKCTKIFENPENSIKDSLNIYLIINDANISNDDDSLSH